MISQEIIGWQGGSVTEATLKQLDHAYSFTPRGLRETLDGLIAEIRRLRAVIQEVIDDDESREDGTGWGPDVTMLLKLKAALREPSTDPADQKG